MGDASQKSKKIVLVTGFGPFTNHEVNASWQSVKQMPGLEPIGDDVELVIQEIPVIYDTVSSCIPQLWEKYKPHLVVHVGVSGIAKELTLEQQAHNDKYVKNDMLGTCPTSQCCVEGGPCCLVSGINMNQVCSEVNNTNCGVTSVVSNDPGRYLCDYIYFSSLYQDHKRTAFIHVPPLDAPYSAKELAVGLREAILSMLNQID